MAMDDTRASDSPLEPVVDKTYGKELTCMEPHPVFNDHFVLWPLYQGFEIQPAPGVSHWLLQAFARGTFRIPNVINYIIVSPQ